MDKVHKSAEDTKAAIEGLELGIKWLKELSATKTGTGRIISTMKLAKLVLEEYASQKGNVWVKEAMELLKEADELINKSIQITSQDVESIKQKIKLLDIRVRIARFFHNKIEQPQATTITEGNVEEDKISKAIGWVDGRIENAEKNRLIDFSKVTKLSTLNEMKTFLQSLK